MSKILTVEKCKCGKIPLPHVSVEMSGYKYHPVFSKTGVIICVRREREDGQFNAVHARGVRRYVRSLSLPQTHPFDIAMEHLEFESVDSAGPDVMETTVPHSRFFLCPFCGSHGTLINKYGNIEGQPRTREEAITLLEEALFHHLVDLRDELRLREEIEEARLPQKSTNEDEDEEEEDEDSNWLSL